MISCSIYIVDSLRTWKAPLLVGGADVLCHFRFYAAPRIKQLIFINVEMQESRRETPQNIPFMRCKRSSRLYQQRSQEQPGRTIPFFKDFRKAGAMSLSLRVCRDIFKNYHVSRVYNENCYIDWKALCAVHAENPRSAGSRVGLRRPQRDL